MSPKEKRRRVRMATRKHQKHGAAPQSLIEPSAVCPKADRQTSGLPPSICKWGYAHTAANQRCTGGAAVNNAEISGGRIMISTMRSAG